MSNDKILVKDSVVTTESLVEKIYQTTDFISPNKVKSMLEEIDSLIDRYRVPAMVNIRELELYQTLLSKPDFKIGDEVTPQMLMTFLDNSEINNVEYEINQNGITLTYLGHTTDYEKGIKDDFHSTILNGLDQLIKETVHNEINK